MTLNDRHINKTSFTPSPAHTALKKAARVIGKGNIRQVNNHNGSCV